MEKLTDKQVEVILNLVADKFNSCKDMEEVKRAVEEIRNMAKKERGTMYKHIIQIREDVPEEKLEELAEIAAFAFDNRAGKVGNVSSTPYRFIFEGGEEAFGCLNLGMLDLWDKKDFVACVKNWQWIDEEDPDENCDVIKELSSPVI